MSRMYHTIHRHRLIIVSLLIFIGCIGSYLYFTKNYTQYDMYEKDNKRIGILQHYTQELPGRYYISLYYPQFKEPALVQVIESYKDRHLQMQPNNKMRYISIDYASNRVLDRFIQITFYQTIKNEKKKFLNKEVTHFIYDEQLHRLITIDDILQGDYKQSIQNAAQKQNIENINEIDLQNFQIANEGIIFYMGTNASFTYPYDIYSQYFKLKM